MRVGAIDPVDDGAQRPGVDMVRKGETASPEITGDEGGGVVSTPTTQQRQGAQQAAAGKIDAVARMPPVVQQAAAQAQATEDRTTGMWAG